jgi:hypothetical protein
LLHRSVIRLLIELLTTKGYALTTKRGFNIGIGQPRSESRRV